LFLTNICPNGIIEPYPNLSDSLSYLFFIPKAIERATEFEWENKARKILDIYEKILGEKRERAST
jgi:hypothetical protein